MTKCEKFKNGFLKIKNSRANDFINKILYSPYGTAIPALLTLICHIFGLEILLYIFVAIYTVYICVLGKDFLPIMPLFIFCYVSPSTKNNPALTTDSVFYNTPLIVTILAIVIPAILIRIGLDKNMGYKKLFTLKRKLLIGMLVLGGAYLLSGVGSKGYFSLFGNNLLFSLLQFLSIFLLYFVFTATVDWKNTPKDYFAWVGVIMGLLVSAELLELYILEDVIQNGSIIRGKLYTGWGHYNNMGVLIGMAIPFAFYLAYKKRHNYIYLALGTLLLITLILSCSRGSIVGGVFIYGVCLVITFIKCNHKKTFRISTAVLVGIGIIFAIIFHEFLIKLFQKVPTIINKDNNSLSFNDSSRFVIYKEGFLAFLKYPLFGQTFYPTDYVPYDFSRLDSFSTFFPPRWHNTIIQILSSCGIVGIVAYGYHRFETIKLMIKKPSAEKTFIGLSLAVMLLTSMLDCHFFNIGPTLIYSMGLAFAEKINEE